MADGVLSFYIMALLVAVPPIIGLLNTNLWSFLISTGLIGIGLALTIYVDPRAILVFWPAALVLCLIPIWTRRRFETAERRHRETLAAIRSSGRIDEPRP